MLTEQKFDIILKKERENESRKIEKKNERNKDTVF